MSLNVVFVGRIQPYRRGNTMACAEIVRGLHARGHRIRAVGPVEASAEEIATAYGGGVEVTEIPSIGPYNASWKPTPDHLRCKQAAYLHDALSRLVAEERPDVILVGQKFFIFGIPDDAATWRIPVAVMSHGPIARVADGTAPDQVLAERYLAELRKVEAIFACAGHVAEALHSLGFGNVHAISNAVDLTAFGPGPRDPGLCRDLGIKDGQFVAAFVSVVSDSKRPLDFVAAAPRVLERYPDTLFLVVGDGKLRAATEDAVRRAGLTSHFRFTGWVSYDRVPDYLRLADVVVMASDNEGLARVYLEAQACGRVLLASDIAAAREVIDDGKSGRLFALGDIADLAEKLIVLAGDPVLRAKIGRGARAAAVARRDIDDTAIAYERVLENLTPRQAG